MSYEHFLSCFIFPPPRKTSRKVGDRTEVFYNDLEMKGKPAEIWIEIDGELVRDSKLEEMTKPDGWA